jgi:hypothetical protein
MRRVRCEGAHRNISDLILISGKADPIVGALTEDDAEQLSTPQRLSMTMQEPQRATPQEQSARAIEAEPPVRVVFRPIGCLSRR